MGQSVLSCGWKAFSKWRLLRSSFCLFSFYMWRLLLIPFTTFLNAKIIFLLEKNVSENVNFFFFIFTSAWYVPCGCYKTRSHKYICFLINRRRYKAIAVYIQKRKRVARKVFTGVTIWRRKLYQSIISENFLLVEKPSTVITCFGAIFSSSHKKLIRP